MQAPFRTRVWDYFFSELQCGLFDAAGPAPSAGLASVALAASLAAGPYNRAQVALLAASDTGSLSAIFLLTCSHLVELSLDLRQAMSLVRIRRCLRASRFSRSVSQLSLWRSSAIAGAKQREQRAARWLRSDLLLPATPSASSRSPSKLVTQAAHLLQ